MVPVGTIIACATFSAYLVIVLYLLILLPCGTNFHRYLVLIIIYVPFFCLSVVKLAQYPSHSLNHHILPRRLTFLLRRQGQEPALLNEGLAFNRLKLSIFNITPLMIKSWVILLNIYK